MIRSVQQARRDAGLEVTDRMRLSLAAPLAVVAAVEAHRELIAAETLAVEVAFTVASGTDLVVSVEKA